MQRHVKNVTMMYCDVIKRSQKIGLRKRAILSWGLTPAIQLQLQQSLEGSYYIPIQGLMPCLLPVMKRNAQNSADLSFARAQFHPLYLLSRHDVAHVTPHTRPSRFSACNIESWVGPGDEARWASITCTMPFFTNDSWLIVGIIIDLLTWCHPQFYVGRG